MSKVLGLAALLWLAVAPAWAAPAVWRAFDADTEVFLFGGVHLLRPDVAWLDDDLKARFATADRIYMEISLEERAPEALLPVLLRHAVLTPPATLAERLPAGLHARLDEEMRRVGVDPATLKGARPWFAGTLAMQTGLAQLGYREAEGVEAVLAGLAAGRPILGLESAEDGISPLGRLSPAEEVEFVRETLAEMPDLERVMNATLAAWLAGDLEALERAGLDAQFRNLPELRRALIAERNRKWADAIAGEAMAAPGVAFVAVGAAHLVGAESLVRMLEARGVAVERVR